MYCTKCGKEIMLGGQKFCPHCGAEIANPEGSIAAARPNMPMKWYKFLIYFALYFSALGNVGMAISYFAGMAYGDLSADMVYSVYGTGLKILDICYALLSLVAAAFCIIAREKLAKFKLDGPKFLAWSYVLNFGIGILYGIGKSIIVGGGFNVTNMVGSILVIIIALCINDAYFGKRSHLFVN